MAEYDQNFTIGTLSRRAGCSIDTIRYYERMQLMPEVRRTAGGHRLYDGKHARRLAFIRRSRALGLGLDQVRQVLRRIEENTCSCPEVRSLLAERTALIRGQMEELQKIERDLKKMLAACADAQSVSCRVIEAMLAGEDDMLDAGCCSVSGHEALATD